ncbi:MAG: cob(I)yrinic acid a,c-diamide adenosyltransferase [Bacteroidota bacterium]
MKIYTKTGDKGLTSLIGGTRVAKYDLRIECYGTVDELNSYIGLIGCQPIDIHHQTILKEIQDRLFTIGAYLASDPERSKMKIPDLRESDVTLLEVEMDQMNESLPELKNFVLPGSHTTVSYCHIARCVCRKCERLVFELGSENEVDGKVTTFLNRLSDYLFMLSRRLNMDLGTAENIWFPRV